LLPSLRGGNLKGGEMSKNSKTNEILSYNKKLIPLAKELRNNMTLSEVIL
jgi:hypothetical protein